MSKWKDIKGTDLKTLRATRKALHQAIQLVSILPRNILPHDPTDGTASLEWNQAAKGLQSIPVQNDGKLQVCAGLSLSNFELYLSSVDMEIGVLSLEGLTINKALNWLKAELEKLMFPANKLSLHLPYEVEAYDHDQPLNIDKQALKEYSKLYRNTNTVLTELVKKWEKAFDIRCWPHHFDLATLIPVETDKMGEILKSIGVGLSPGDESIDEPYLYVNVWPTIDRASLMKHKLPSGHWNPNGWSGAVLTYTEMLEQEPQQEGFAEFTEIAIQKILNELK